MNPNIARYAPHNVTPIHQGRKRSCKAASKKIGMTIGAVTPDIIHSIGPPLALPGCTKTAATKASHAK
jgi:hypothetical protein